MKKNNVLSALIMCGLSLSFALNSMAMLPAARQTAKRFQGPTVSAAGLQGLTPAMQQVAAVRAYSTGRPQGSLWGRFTSGLSYYANYFRSLFSRRSPTSATDLSVAQKLSQRIKPAVDYGKQAAQSAAQVIGNTSVAQKGVAWVNASLQEIAEDKALPLIAELRNKSDEIGTVYFATEYDGKLSARRDWWKRIFDICEGLTGHRTIDRFSSYQKSDRIAAALNQKLAGDRTILGHFFENFITTVPSSAADIVTAYKFGKRYNSFGLDKVRNLDGFFSISDNIDSLMKLGAQLSEPDIVVIRDQFAQWIDRINSGDDKVYDAVVLCSLIQLFDRQDYLENIFNRSGELGKSMYSFTSSNGTVYKINEEKLRAIPSAAYYSGDDVLPKKISDIGALKTGSISHSDQQEQELKSAISGLFKESAEITARKIERV